MPFLYLSKTISKVVFGRHCSLPPSFFLHWQTFRLYWLNHPRWPLFFYDDFLALGRLSLRWPNQDLLSIELHQVHVCRECVFIKLHLGTLCKFQSSFIYGRLNLSMENIAIVSSMRIRSMSFIIRMLFELFRQWYDMTTCQFNLFFLQHVIKNPITLSDVKSVVYLILSAFRSQH
jgi:hypothetical protein